MQGAYVEADVDTGALKTQHTRKHYISPHMTETEVVDTAFYLCLRSMEHRCREEFKYKAVRTHSPHMSIEARLDAMTRYPPDKRP